MSHKVKVTVIDKKLYPELQEQYCMDPKSGACPCYNVGTSLYSAVMTRMTTSGTAGLIHL